MIWIVATIIAGNKVKRNKRNKKINKMLNHPYFIQFTQIRTLL